MAELESQLRQSQAKAESLTQQLTLHKVCVCLCLCQSVWEIYTHPGLIHIIVVERNGSGVELRTLNYENPGSNSVVLKLWASVFIVHWSSSFSCINEYLAIDSGGYVYDQPSHINCSIWLDASQRSRDGV